MGHELWEAKAEVRSTFDAGETRINEGLASVKAFKKSGVSADAIVMFTGRRVVIRSLDSSDEWNVHWSEINGLKTENRGFRSSKVGVVLISGEYLELVIRRSLAGFLGSEFNYRRLRDPASRSVGSVAGSGLG